MLPSHPHMQVYIPENAYLAHSCLLPAPTIQLLAIFYILSKLKRIISVEIIPCLFSFVIVKVFIFITVYELLSVLNCVAVPLLLFMCPLVIL